MAAYKFERAKLKRLLSTYGVKYHFERMVKNEFGEPNADGEVSKTIGIVGVYHEQNQAVQISTSNGVRYRTEKRPFILAEYGDASQLEADDRLVYGGVVYKVIGVSNVNNMDIYGDVSLEVVDVGGKV